MVSIQIHGKQMKKVIVIINEKLGAGEYTIGRNSCTIWLCVR